MTDNDNHPLFQLIQSDLVPEGTLYIVDPAAGTEWMSAGPIRVREDVWWQPVPPGLTKPALTERQRALGYLEDQLDRMCRDLGLDPEAAWRRPRLEERDRARVREHRWIIEQSIGMSVLFDPKSAVKITLT